jgi:hypothetical protein
MSKSVFVGALAAAVAMFFWGFIYWGISPIPYQIMRPVPDEAGFVQKVAPSLAESSAYLLPHPTQADAMKKQQKGPIGIILWRSGPGNSPGLVFGGGFVHMFVSALLMAMLLRMALPALPGYGTRVCFVALAGLAGATFSHLGAPFWWHGPWSFHLLGFVYDSLGWLIAGLVLAKLVRS